jgi:hypothetical protein
MVQYYDYRNIFSGKMFISILQFYDHVLVCLIKLRVQFEVPVAIYVKGISLNIKDNRKIIAVSEDNRWIPKYR